MFHMKDNLTVTCLICLATQVIIMLSMNLLIKYICTLLDLNKWFAEL